MKKLYILAALIAATLVLGAAAPMRTTLIRTSTADPCIVYDHGTFYLTMTGSTKIAMIVDKDLANLTTAAHPTTESIIYDSSKDISVEELFGDGVEYTLYLTTAKG